jgi:hypothetical protein
LAALAERLEELGDTIQEAVMLGSRDLAAEMVEHVLASLKSHLPNVPLEVALDGIVPNDEETAREQVRGLAADAVAMFVPTAGGSPPTDGDGGLASSNPPAEEESEASSNTGQ